MAQVVPKVSLLDLPLPDEFDSPDVRSSPVGFGRLKQIVSNGDLSPEKNGGILMSRAFTSKRMSNVAGSPARDPIVEQRERACSTPRPSTRAKMEEEHSEQLQIWDLAHRENREGNMGMRSYENISNGFAKLKSEPIQARYTESGFDLEGLKGWKTADAAFETTKKRRAFSVFFRNPKH